MCLSPSSPDGERFRNERPEKRREPRPRPDCSGVHSRTVGVRTVGTVAPYILAAEVVLGAVTWHAWRVARERPATLTPVLALLVSLTYTGAAVASTM